MATTSNSMIFKNLAKNYTSADLNLLNLTLLETYDISGIILVNDFTSTDSNLNSQLLSFNPVSGINNNINAISFDCILKDSSKQALTLFLDGVKTIYTLNKLQIVPVYPYISNGTTTNRPTNYALAIDFNSYNNPLKEKLMIYIPITSDANKENALLKFLYTNLDTNYTSSNNSKKITKTDNISLTSVIPSNRNYYCHNFTNTDNINVKNIFFDNTYILYYTGDSTKISNKLTTDSTLRDYTINTSVPYYYKSSKYVNYVDELYTSPMQDIYIDCSPADMNLSDKNNVPYLQRLTQSMQYGSDNMTLTLSYLAFMLLIAFIAYLIYKIPTLFTSNDTRLLTDVIKATGEMTQNLKKQS
jgi:hypothetical protein